MTTFKAPRQRLRFRYLWPSLRNWLKGYQFRPVQRFRCCGHTTPYAHATTCTYKDIVRGR